MMERLKRIVKKLLSPPAALLVLLTLLSIPLLILALSRAEEQGILHYVTYLLSFYTLVACACRVPQILCFIKEIKEHNPLVHRIVTDTRFRLKLTLLGSLVLNTAYALFQLGMGFYYRSRWFFALTVYYILLTVMRFFLLRDLRQLTPGSDYHEELRRYRFCGIALAAMTPALLAIVAFILFEERGFSYNSISTIAMAAYTFGAFTVAVVNIIKYRKYNSPLLSAAKAVSMTTASVAMLSLETAMLSAFGSESDAVFRGLITGLSGMGVCLFVLGMSIFMITRAAKELKTSNQGDQHGAY